MQLYNVYLIKFKLSKKKFIDMLFYMKKFKDIYDLFSHMDVLLTKNQAIFYKLPPKRSHNFLTTFDTNYFMYDVVNDRFLFPKEV